MTKAIEVHLKEEGGVGVGVVLLEVELSSEWSGCAFRIKKVAKNTFGPTGDIDDPEGKSRIQRSRRSSRIPS